MAAQSLESAVVGIPPPQCIFVVSALSPFDAFHIKGSEMG